MKTRNVFRKVSSIFLVLFAFVSTSAKADLIFEQTVDLNYVEYVSANPNPFAADNFTVAQSSSINQLVFWGYTVAPQTIFDIAIYNSLGGQPDTSSTAFSQVTLVAEELLPIPPIFTQLGPLPLTKFTLDFAAPLVLAAGDYFLQVAADINTGLPFGWQQSTADGNAPDVGIPNFGVIPTGGPLIVVPGAPATNFAFQLNGVANQTIPLPSTFLLLLVALPLGRRFCSNLRR